MKAMSSGWAWRKAGSVSENHPLELTEVVLAQYLPRETIGHSLGQSIDDPAEHTPQSPSIPQLVTAG
jgi:hypothetical protein